MSHKVYSNIRVFDPEQGGKELKFGNVKELRKIMESWLLNSKIIELVYGTEEIIYVMSNDRIAEHLSDGNMGDEFRKYGDRHLRAKKILAELDELE